MIPKPSEKRLVEKRWKTWMSRVHMLYTYLCALRCSGIAVLQLYQQKTLPCRGVDYRQGFQTPHLAKHFLDFALEMHDSPKRMVGILYTQNIVQSWSIVQYFNDMCQEHQKQTSKQKPTNKKDNNFSHFSSYLFSQHPTNKTTKHQNCNPTVGGTSPVQPPGQPAFQVLKPWLQSKGASMYCDT